MRFALARYPVLVAALALVTACSGGDAPAGESTSLERAPVDGGTAVFSTVSDYDALNGFVSTDFDTSEVLGNVLFMPLVRLDEDLGYVPHLADSMWMSDDGLALSFRIREGVRWHDGTPVTVDDVIWTYEYSIEPDLAYANIQYFQFIDRAERVDDRTVTFHFTEVHSEAPIDFAEWEPMPKHLLEGTPPAEMKNHPFNRNPVGNGPFRFVSWTPNQQAVFEANEEYVFGRPHLDRFVSRVIPEQTTEVAELLTGGIDLMRAVPPAEMEKVERSDRAKTVTYPTNAYTFLAWNGQNPLFEDPAVRRALTMAIDRQRIIDALLYGYGRVATADVLPFQWEFDESIEAWPHDPERAKAILAEAGWEDTDGDGTLDRDGRPFSFELGTNQGNDLREDIIVIAQNQLAAIGVDARPRLVEWNTFITNLKARKFEAAVSGWAVDLKFDPTPVMSCKAVDAPYNYTSFCNPRADSLITEALTTLDREEAKPIWDAYQRIIHEEQPYTFLYYLEERLGVSDRLQGLEADARGYLINIGEWWIPESRQGRTAPVAANVGQ